MAPLLRLVESKLKIISKDREQTYVDMKDIFKERKHTCKLREHTCKDRNTLANIENTHVSSGNTPVRIGSPEEVELWISCDGDPLQYDHRPCDKCKVCGN
jgi:hypothetical protein